MNPPRKWLGAAQDHILAAWRAGEPAGIEVSIG
jgi:hypothetical protein